jgi:sensor histidine kinase YesM
MFVQPFIENAIQHGLMDLGGRIEVEFRHSNEYIEILVRDNGVGVSSISLAKGNHRSLATSIIRERIDNYNRKLKNQIKLSILDRSEKNEKGTEIHLFLPFQKN